MKQVEIMRATPNNYETWQMLMLLGHTLSQQNGKQYYVEINNQHDCIILRREA